MKIMLVGQYPPPISGISIHIKRLKYYLEQEGHRCYICSFDKSQDEIRNDFIIIRTIKKIWKKKNNFFWETKKLDPDIIHIHHDGSKFFNEMELVLYWKIMGKRVFITFHGGYLPQYILQSGKKELFSLSLLLIMVDKIICVNKQQRDAILNKFGYSKSKKLSIVSPFLLPYEQKIKENRINQEATKFYNNKHKIVTTIGGWSRYQHFECLINAFELLHREDANWGLVFIMASSGKPSYKSEIVDILRHKNLEKDALILENINNIVPYLEKSKIFIRSSSIDGCPLSVAEALWCGIPVIANGIVNRPFDIVTFVHGDEDDLFKKIKKVDNSYGIYVELAKKEGKRVAEETKLALGVYN